MSHPNTSLLERWFKLAEKGTTVRTELLAGFLLTAILAYILESRAGAVHAQDWEFYATVVCLYLIFAFPCFVWRYFWNERNRE